MMTIPQCDDGKDLPFFDVELLTLAFCDLVQPACTNVNG
jgi:hypothetical protein